MTAFDARDGRERILVVGNPYLGDTVLALPVLRNLRLAFPGHAIDFLTEGRGVGRLLAGCPWVDDVLHWPRPPRPAAGLRRRPLGASLASLEARAAALRLRRHARAYVLKASTSAALLVFRAGIPRRVGHATRAGHPLFTTSVRRRRASHYADSLLDLLRADGVPIADPAPAHWGPSAAAHGRVDASLARLPTGRRRVFVAIRATDGRRQWPLDRWVDVLRRIVHAHDCEIVFCGGPDDAAAIAAIAADLGPAAAHAHDLSVAVPLEDVAALLSRMDLYLGVNSGLMHLAAACGTPTIAIFDAADAVRWAPRVAAHAMLRGAAPRRGVGRWLGTGSAGSPGWASGAAVRSVTVDAVVTQVAAFLDQAGASTLSTLDLRTGRRRYDVIELPAAAPAAAEPATKPLAQAH